MPKRIRESVDKECKKHGITSHVVSVGGRFRCRSCRIDAVNKRRKILKLKSIEYKGGSCSRCNYSKCIEALEFHHTDPSQKDFSISHDGHTRSWDKIKYELDKCILVCANCHREVHFEERNKVQYTLKDAEKIKEVNLECVHCKKSFSLRPSEAKDRLYCSNNCFQISHRKVSDRPTKEELEKLLWEMPTINISKIYGVSDKSIEKWSKAYGITKPPRGYWAKKAFGKV
jgi:hypothetical protein